MDPVKRQYETYPYPARDPADEAVRLIEGSPSRPVEIDHFLFQGQRDWTRPFRALVAGGGTGDGLIMLAQKLADIGCPAEIIYLDISEASRAIAEARARTRNLTIQFVNGDLLNAPELGPFDYIDCCGVLHHLPDPDAGLAVLAQALAPEGGMGLMVYAHYGRSGVYPLQQAFSALVCDMALAKQVTHARATLDLVPETHPFRRNMILGDHRDSDAGLYDLLLHSRDRAYSVCELCNVLDRAGLGLVSFVEPARYDPLRYLPEHPDLISRVKAMSPTDRMAVAEKLAGNIKMHIAYVAHADRAAKAEAKPTRPALVPHLSRVAAGALAKQVHAQGVFTATVDGHGFQIEIPRTCASLVARVDGRTSLGQMQAGQDWMTFLATWNPVHRALTGMNLLHYSKGGK
ncbi:MAG: class I SAM-dependent methyltransferase [Paracoccaceae bacterium]